MRSQRTEGTEMSKQMKSFRLDETVSLDLAAFAERYGCSQADVIEAALEVFEQTINQLEELTAQRIAAKVGTCDYTPSMKQISKTVQGADFDIS